MARPLGRPVCIGQDVFVTKGPNEGKRDEQEVMNLELESLGLLPCVVGVTCESTSERWNDDQAWKQR